MTDFGFVRSKLSVSELLCQLAEEATELSHAALKYRRALNGDNPTPVDSDSACLKLMEEIADVKVCLITLGFTGENIESSISKIVDTKISRWAGRLREKNGD